VLPLVTTNPSETASTELRETTEEFVVGGALGPDSNGSLDHLLASVANLRKTGRRAKLVVFAAPGVRPLATKAAAEELRPDVRWAQDDLSARDLLQKCNVLVSLQDGVPLLVLRAMASRVPIITTAVRIPEALRNQRTATFIHHVDKDELQ
jgi:glycosyltransferase involved in cell wall biosynthesis